MRGRHEKKRKGEGTREQIDNEQNRARVMAKLGGAGDRFGDNWCVDSVNLPYAGGDDQFTNTKFTRPNAQISESSDGIKY